MRTSSLLLPLAALAACSSEEERAAEAQVTRAPATPTAAEPRVPCAQGGGELAPVCTVEREETEDGPVLTIRHPDGAFRRLRVTRDGRGVIAADGAEPARVTLVGDAEIEVTLGEDRYRLPATRQGQAPTP